jgi:hypothetical protein
MARRGAKSDKAATPQELMDIDTERGYHGTVPDPTPNAAYTVAGVTSGAATPETDEDAKAEAEATTEAVATGNEPE